MKNRLTGLTRTKTWEELLSFSYDTLLDNGLPSLTFSQVTNSTDVASSHLQSICNTLDINLCQYALRVKSPVAVKLVVHDSILAFLPSLILMYGQMKLIYGGLAKHFQIWACVCVKDKIHNPGIQLCN